MGLGQDRRHYDMTSASLIALPAPQIVEIVGADALAFAQAQFSSNLAELENGHWQWSAWLSAQGRVRAFFHLLRDDDEHLRLVLRGGSAAQLYTALARYVFRAKVQLHKVEKQYAYIARRQASLDRFPTPPADRLIASNSGETCIALPGATPRWLLLTAEERGDAERSAAAQNENALADIDAGLVTLSAEIEDKLLPMWIGLDALAATSTNKGCYPGQEIVARLHFKGGNKRQLRRVTYSTAELPEPGATIDMKNGESALIVCSAWASESTAAALAVTNDSGVKLP